MASDLGGTTPGSHFVLRDDEGNAFWFLNTLTINKVEGDDTHGDLTIVDHRVPAGFNPPPHVHRGVDEAFYILEGEFEGFCGDTQWQAGPGSLVFLPRDLPHGFKVTDASPGRTLLILAPAGFDRFVAALGEPAAELTMPTPTQPDIARVVEIAAAHGIQILPPPVG
jgi:quercetin dioxygenase-like cupin family protein